MGVQSFKDTLSGEQAFYKQPDYYKNIQRDFAQNELLPVAYTCNTESKIYRIARYIFCTIVFPIGIYKLFHALAGKIILPSSTPSFLGRDKNYANDIRSKIFLYGNWKFKRFTVEVDGYKIDATIVGQESTLGNGRWVLAANGNSEFYEDKLGPDNCGFKQILSEVKGNAIIFNYPGVGASSSVFPSRTAMEKASRAMLKFLEDNKNGIGAKEIIAYGHSLGGGVLSDVSLKHELKKDIKYVFVKTGTFSDFQTITSNLTIKLLGLFVKILGWNMDSVASSKKLQAPEIIMQTASVETKTYEKLTNSSLIIDDGVIPANASLAKVLLDDEDFVRKNKVFIGMSETHNEEIEDPLFLANEIEKLLKPQESKL